MLFGARTRPTTMPTAEDTLPGRAERPFALSPKHAVLGTPVEGPVPDGYAEAFFAMGCFWGAEKRFWQTPGVWSTASGYAGGTTPNPTYEEVCSGHTGQTETVRVVFDPAVVSYADLLSTFWESHDPTQGYRQGNDHGTQYRSAVFTTSPEQQAQALASRAAYQERLRAAGFGEITTEIVPAGTFYYAEDYHQQYLHKVPDGYCPDHGTGVSCPVGLLTQDQLPAQQSIVPGN